MDRKQIIKAVKFLAFANLLFGAGLVFMAAYLHFVLHEQVVIQKLLHQILFSIVFFCVNYLFIALLENRDTK